jgi:polyhydroxyalkanoate synthesis regulator protein
MDWTKQSEEMFKAWTQAQTKMWEAYSENVSGFGKTPGEKVWAQTIAAGEDLVKNSLAAQADWMKTWVENFKKLEGLPDQAAEAVDQFREMTGSWAATQEKLWAAWFDMLKKFDPNPFAAMPKDPFQVWQESTKQVMEMQMDWARAWMEQFKPDQED